MKHCTPEKSVQIVVKSYLNSTENHAELSKKLAIALKQSDALELFSALVALGRRFESFH